MRMKQDVIWTDEEKDKLCRTVAKEIKKGNGVIKSVEKVAKQMIRKKSGALNIWYQERHKYIDL